MFMYPMMLPFMIYQRWLETVFLPFLGSYQTQTNTAMSETSAMQNEVVDKTRPIAKSAR